MQVFANNAETTLTAILDEDEAAVTMEVADATSFASVSGGNYQLATLTHVSLAGMYEVVRITALTGGTDFTVVRQVEGGMQAWPIGTKVQARVTAGMLAGFPQQDLDGAIKPSSGDIVRLGASRASGGAVTEQGLVAGGGVSRVPGAVQIAGPAMLQLSRSAPGDEVDRNYGLVQTGSTHPVDLGTAVAWSAVDFYRGSVVRPTAGGTHQYWLDITNVGSNTSYDTTEPTWNTTTGAAADNGHWYPQNTPVDLTTPEYQGLVITEVGFICNVYTASGAPSVSIGTTAAPTLFANNVAMSALGDATIHRIPITAGAVVNFDQLRFQVTSAATGGRCLGRFYWVGYFVEFDVNL